MKSDKLAKALSAGETLQPGLRSPLPYPGSRLGFCLNWAWRLPDVQQIGIPKHRWTDLFLLEPLVQDIPAISFPWPKWRENPLCNKSIKVFVSEVSDEQQKDVYKHLS